MQWLVDHIGEAALEEIADILVQVGVVSLGVVLVNSGVPALAALGSTLFEWSSSKLRSSRSSDKTD